jgi:hypothetical protein
VDLIDYWHFNNLPQPAVAITSVNADSTATGNAVITYPGTGAGYMDPTEPNKGDLGSDVNSQLGQPSGIALRVRNPSNTRYLLITAPTTGYTNIIVKYATVRTSKGAQDQRVSYTTDGSTWILNLDDFVPPIDPAPYALDSLNFSDDANVNNNPLFAVKIEFYGSQSTGTSGNDRFDNITVSGNAISSCGIPSGLAATNITTTTTTISWDALTGANNYDVDYKVHTAATWTNAATATTSLTVNLNGLSANTLYDYRVRSNCSSGTGDYNTSQFTTSCGIPSGLTATNITTNTATVSWDANGANSYDVDYKAHTASTWTNAATATTSLSVNLSGLSANTLYDYRVRSNCSSSSGDYATSQFTTINATSCNSLYDGTMHNSFATAVPIPLNTNVNGTISSATDTDYYKFTVTQTGYVTVTLSTLPANYDLYVYNDKFKQYKPSTKLNTKTETVTKSMSPGTHYIKIVGVNNAFDAVHCYTLNVTPASGLLNSESPNISAAIADNSLHLFPNPVSSVLNLNTSGINSGAIIKVVDIFGKTVLSQQIISSSSKINVSKLANSTYLLIVINKNGSIISTSKFVKQ